MNSRLTLRREQQLVQYAIYVLDKKFSCIIPIQTKSCLFPIIFMNRKSERRDEIDMSLPYLCN